MYYVLCKLQSDEVSIVGFISTKICNLSFAATSKRSKISASKTG